jgi:hypothetical protein
MRCRMLKLETMTPETAMAIPVRLVPSQCNPKDASMKALNYSDTFRVYDTMTSISIEVLVHLLIESLGIALFVT